jgi:hypothetical protein
MKKMKESKKLDNDASFVCLLSGNGLKDPVSPLKILAEPPTIDPRMVEVDKILSSEILNIRSFGAKKRDAIMFSEVPNKQDLKKVLKEKFEYKADKVYFDKILEQIKNFIEKGKKVAKADLQYIIENTIQSYIPKEKVTLKVKDFEITTKYQKSPEAQMKVIVNGNEHKVKASGVGPVDAAINALVKACSKNGGFPISLTDYNVMINNQGTDTAVDVKMTLESGEKLRVVGRGTSPDIIQASIDAFVNGYNVLAQKQK